MDEVYESTGWMITLRSTDGTKIMQIPNSIIPTSDRRLQNLLLAEEESMMRTMEERCNLDDEQLLDLIGPRRQFVQKDPKRIVILFRKYFQSVTANKGFSCYHFPGHISDLTPVVPKYKIIYSVYTESGSHVRHMTKFALDSYNRAAGTRFRIQKLKNVNKWSDQNIYYITFVGWETREKREDELDDESGPFLTFETTFLVKVQDRTSLFFRELVEDVKNVEDNMFLVLEINALGSDYKEDSDVEDSDEEDYDETTDEEDDEVSDNEEDLNPVELARENGSHITDAELLKWMIGDGRSLAEKKKLLPKVRRYLKTIWESEGFECDNFPGRIWTVTTWQPNQKVIDMRHRYSEGYDHMIYLASLAIISFNQTNDTKFIVKSIETVNVSGSNYYNYAITFTAQQLGTQYEEIFQAKVVDNIREVVHEVTFCRLKSAR